MMNQYTTKIENQIASLDKKISALSGNYLTNTRKRQAEQQERDRKKDQFRQHKQLLEYLLAAFKTIPFLPLRLR